MSQSNKTAKQLINKLGKKEERVLSLLTDHFKMGMFIKTISKQLNLILDNKDLNWDVEKFVRKEINNLFEKHFPTLKGSRTRTKIKKISKQIVNRQVAKNKEDYYIKDKSKISTTQKDDFYEILFFYWKEWLLNIDKNPSKGIKSQHMKCALSDLINRITKHTSKNIQPQIVKDKYFETAIKMLQDNLKGKKIKKGPNKKTTNKNKKKQNQEGQQDKTKSTKTPYKFLETHIEDKKVKIPVNIERSKRRKKTIDIKISGEKGVIIQVPHKLEEKTILGHLNNNKKAIISKYKKSYKKYNFINSIEKGYKNLSKEEKIKGEKTIKQRTEELYKATIKKLKKEGYYDKGITLLDGNLSNITIDFKSYVKGKYGQCYRNSNTKKAKITFDPVFLGFQETHPGKAQAIIDYIICHEIAHIRHGDHSRNFWKFLRFIYPHETILLKEAIKLTGGTEKF